MTPKQVALVQGQFCQGCTDFGSRGHAEFYDRLFEIAPQTRAMFPDDMIEQRRESLMAMLAGVVKGLGNLEQVFCFGRQCTGKAACQLRYEGGALSGGRRRVAVDAGEGGLGDDWTPEIVADAWATAYGTLSGYMRFPEAYGRSLAAE